MKRLLPTLVALLALGGIGWYVWKYESKPKEPPPDRPDKIYNEKGEDVVEFKTEELEKKTSMTVRLRPDGEWWITDEAGRSYEADTDAAFQMAKHVASPELDRLLEQQKDLGVFGLDKPMFRATASFKDGHKRVLVVGKKNPTGTGYFAREEGGRDPQVVLAAAWSVEQMRKAKIDLRTKNLTKFEVAQVSRLSLKRGREKLEFKREGEAWRLTAPMNAPADRYAVESLLGEMKSLRGFEIIETENAYSRHKLDQPAAVVTVVTGTGTGQVITLSRPKPAEDTAFATSSRNPYVIKLGSAQAVGAALKPIEEFRERLLLQAGKDDVTTLTLKEGALEIACAKDAKSAKWGMLKPVAAATSTEFDDFLFEAVYVRAERFADDAPKALAPYGLDPPRFAVTLSGTKDGRPFSASYRLGNRAGDRVLLAMDGRPGVVEVRKELLEKAERFAAKVRAPLAPAASPAPAAK